VTYHHPLGYVIALAVPLTVGYIIWQDGHDVLQQVWQDGVARRFGLGIGAVMLLFFGSVEILGGLQVRPVV
jgi:hypothetical protein